MYGKSQPVRLPSTSCFSLLSGLFGLGLLLTAAGPAAAGGTPVDCVPGSKAPPERLIAACTTIIDNNAASRTDRSAALVGRADAHARTSGGMTDAFADLDRAIALDDKNGAAYRLRGDLTREAGGNLNKAEADLTKAIALDPQDIEAYELRGVVYTTQHRLDRAIADYDQVIKLKPDNAQAWSDRGVTYYLAGERPSMIPTKRCGSIRTGRALSPTAAPPTRSSASSTRRLPMPTRRSGSIPRCPNIMTIAGCPMPT